MDINSAGGRKEKITAEQLEALASLRPATELGGIFETSDVLLIQLADALANTPANVSDELFAALQAHYSEEQLMEIAAFCAQENYRARWNRLANVESHNFYRVKRPETQAAD